MHDAVHVVPPQPQRIAAFDEASVAAFRLGLRLGSDLRSRGRTRRSLGRSLTLFCDTASTDRFNDARLGYRTRRLLRCNLRRVEEEGVFANQTTGRPVQLDKKIQEGLIDGLQRRDLDDCLPIGALFDRKPQIKQHAGEVHAGLPERILRCQPRTHSGQFILRRTDIQFGSQRLPQP
ncbi:hypothetical protein SDC9_194074 [bioreactor metagenome]|uniref:Uncharacterized protein n=1 Tax=bioreactor metagenome TaxID=1076179 RepID=A0A645I5G5_9ZZZZ